jgi:hypothetical protein
MIEKGVRYLPRPLCKKVERTIAIVTYPTYGKNLVEDKGESISYAGRLRRRGLNHAPAHFPNNVLPLKPFESIVEVEIVHRVVISLGEQ